MTTNEKKKEKVNDTFCRRVRSSLLQQNVFIRDAVPVKVDKRDFLIRSYVTQDEFLEGSSVVTKTREEPYPITPESVNSFSDGTNYRMDIQRAVSSSPLGRNLCDVASMQNLLSMSNEELDCYFANVREKILSSRDEKLKEKKKEEVIENG